MKDTMTRCARCHGRKKVFKINSGYSIVDTGGFEITCPLCLGSGYNKPIVEAIEEMKTFYGKEKDKRLEKTKEKDFKHEK